MPQGDPTETSVGRRGWGSGVEPGCPLSAAPSGLPIPPRPSEAGVGPEEGRGTRGAPALSHPAPQRRGAVASRARPGGAATAGAERGRPRGLPGGRERHRERR